ncbi:MAG: tyrosine-type recombinase/integrase [Bianqueaceae bacterium]
MYLQKGRIPYRNFHALRHTFATKCIELGVDIKSLSEILGHSSVTITLNRYVHSSMDLKQQQINKLEQLASL